MKIELHYTTTVELDINNDNIEIATAIARQYVTDASSGYGGADREQIIRSLLFNLKESSPAYAKVQKYK